MRQRYGDEVARQQQEFENKRVQSEIDFRKQQYAEEKQWREDELQMKFIEKLSPDVQMSELSKIYERRGWGQVDFNQPEKITTALKDAVTIVGQIHHPKATKEQVQAGRRLITDQFANLSTKEEIATVQPYYEQAMKPTIGEPQEGLDVLIPDNIVATLGMPKGIKMTYRQAKSIGINVASGEGGVKGELAKLYVEYGVRPDMRSALILANESMSKSISDIIAEQYNINTDPLKGNMDKEAAWTEAVAFGKKVEEIRYGKSEKEKTSLEDKLTTKEVLQREVDRVMSAATDKGKAYYDVKEDLMELANQGVDVDFNVLKKWEQYRPKAAFRNPPPPRYNR